MLNECWHVSLTCLTKASSGQWGENHTGECRVNLPDVYPQHNLTQDFKPQHSLFFDKHITACVECLHIIGAKENPLPYCLSHCTVS